MLRMTDQSMPCWYWSDKVTSTMVASISTWRWTLFITLSMNSRTKACWREVARTLMMPASALAIT